MKIAKFSLARAEEHGKAQYGIKNARPFTSLLALRKGQATDKDELGFKAVSLTYKPTTAPLALNTTVIT